MRLLEIKRMLDERRTIYDLPLRVVYYARVSTDKDEQKGSLDNQIFYYEDYIKKNDNWKYGGGYVDEGISGTSVNKRDSFLRMIDDAKHDRFDLIVTKEISRFSRNTLDSIRFTQELLDYGVGVYFQSDNINTLMPDSELRLTIMASIAQEEVRKLSERLRFGYKRSIEKGRVLGQNNILGYDKADGKLSINEEQAGIVRAVFELYAEGKLGSKLVAKELERQGMLSPFTGRPIPYASITAIIQNPKYKGFYCSGKTAQTDYRGGKRIYLPKDQWNVYKDENIPAIVSEELWDRANGIMADRGKRKARGQATQSRYPYSGKLICGEHGCNYNRHVYKSVKDGEKEVWNCRLYRLQGKAFCDSPTLYTEELDTVMTEVYKTIRVDKDRVINGLMEIYESAGSKNYSGEIKRLKAALESVKVKKDTLLELLIDGLIGKEELAERNTRLNNEAGRITTEIQRMENETAASIKNKNDLQRLKKALEREFAAQDNWDSSLMGILDRIIVNKINNDKNHLKLEIYLSPGGAYAADYKKNGSISLYEIGISQAQVSRLEKSALKNMKKYFA